MKLEKIEISKIKPYEKNARKNNEAVKYVAKSIKNFGFLVPIVIDKNNEIIAGHTRYLASKDLKLKEIPCIRAENLTQEQLKAFRIADNKTHEHSTWDYELLKTELEELQNFGVDLEELGFLDFELDDIFNNHTNLDNFFNDEPREQKEKSKKVTCPHCGEEFEV